jgi:hypothetical protein
VDDAVTAAGGSALWHDCVGGPAGEFHGYRGAGEH